MFGSPKQWLVLLAVTLVPSLALAQAPPGVDIPDGDPSKVHVVPDAHGAPPAGKVAAAADDKKKDKKDDDEDEVHHDGPVKMKIGVDIETLGKLDLGPGTYTSEFYVSVTCDHPCKPKMDVANGKLLGKPEMITDEPAHKEFKLKAELNADVDLSEFPFDEHYLPILLIETGDSDKVTFEVDKETTTIDKDIKIAGWEIVGGDATIEKEKVGATHEIPVFHYGLNVKRPRTAAFFKSFVPAIFMIFVAAFTLLLKPKSAPGRLTAATGALMTVVMFHLSATSQLPPLGYLTRLDKFMIGTYFVYMVNIAFAVAIVRFEEAKNEKASNLAHVVAAGVVPGVAVIVYALVLTGII